MFRNAKIKAVAASPSEYHSQKASRGTPEFVMSSSTLRAFWDCPEKWVTPYVDDQGQTVYYDMPGTTSTAWGELFDVLLLTPEQFKARFAVRPDVYPTKDKSAPEKPWSANATYCREWLALKKAAGLSITTKKDISQVSQAIDRFRMDPILESFLQQSQKQVWIEADWHDESGQIVPCKALLDLVPTIESEFAKCLGDVKTTKSARITAWERWAHFAGYDIQAAFYTDMFSAACQDREITEFCFLLSENSPPFQTGRRIMSQDLIDPKNDQGDIASGRRQYRKMLNCYCRCLKASFWPGFDDTDESAGGWTVVRPNPYAEQAREFAPRFSIPGEDEPEDDGDIIP